MSYDIITAYRSNYISHAFIEEVKSETKYRGKIASLFIFPNKITRGQNELAQSILRTVRQDEPKQPICLYNHYPLLSLYQTIGYMKCK